MSELQQVLSELHTIKSEIGNLAKRMGLLETSVIAIETKGEGTNEQLRRMNRYIDGDGGLESIPVRLANHATELKNLDKRAEEDRNGQRWLTRMVLSGLVGLVGEAVAIWLNRKS